MVVEALQNRLKVLEEEILRLTTLAAGQTERQQQDHYWNLARDLQREARVIREQNEKLSESPGAHGGDARAPVAP